MSLPWVNRELLHAAEERLRWTEQQLREAETKLASVQLTLAVLEKEMVRLQERLDEEQTEKRRLMDRVLRLSGQPPLYEAAPPIAAAEPVKSPGLKEIVDARALPVAGTTFKGVHDAAVAAMANGTFDIEKARPRR